MPSIAVEDAQAGMVLAADVTDRRGRLLIPTGRELDPKHLQALKMWGISRVDVEGDDESAGDVAIDPSALGEARDILADRLQNLPMDHPLVMALVETALPRLAAEISGESHGDVQ